MSKLYITLINMVILVVALSLNPDDPECGPEHDEILFQENEKVCNHCASLIPNTNVPGTCRVNCFKTLHFTACEKIVKQHIEEEAKESSKA
nr:crustacean hyperglycemic hormone 6 [Parasteatoda tepidariorum]